MASGGPLIVCARLPDLRIEFMLLGRVREQQEIERVLASARCGESAKVALVGEAGIGKTALLDYAAERAGDMQLLRARGIGTEAQIPFASLLELLRPALLLP